MLEESSISREEAEEMAACFARVREKIKKAAGEREVKLLAATKTVSAEKINYAVDHLGLDCIGENRVQELLEKYDALHKDNLRIDFIGSLQTNKVKYIIDKVDMIHSVDSLKLAQEIDRRAEKIGRVMDVLVEVNIGREASKGGVLPEDLPALLDALDSLEHISVCGMMVIPPKIEAGDAPEKYFTESFQIFLDIFRKKYHNRERTPILSMGMSDSYEIAVENGSDLVRIGSALFGKRNYTAKAESIKTEE